MTEAKQLINWFWSEYGYQKERRHGRRPPIAFTSRFDREGFCQCSSESFIDSSDNPERMRSFLIIGITIDQMMYTHYNDLYYDFRWEYKYPKLRSHLGASMAPPSWFVFSNHGYDKKVDWKAVDFVAGILFKDLFKWLRDRGFRSPDIAKFMNTLSSEISSEFENKSAKHLLSILEFVE
ncbi:MAG: hypothetical protein ACR2P9_06970 [Gammaproteobacteria bacterium]